MTRWGALHGKRGTLVKKKLQFTIFPQFLGLQQFKTIGARWSTTSGEVVIAKIKQNSFSIHRHASLFAIQRADMGNGDE